jgi:hypothetical protein
LRVPPNVARVALCGRRHDDDRETLVVFSAVGTLGVLTPVAIYVAAPARAAPVLGRFRGWLARHETNALVVVGLIIGALFLSDGLDSF